MKKLSCNERTDGRKYKNIRDKNFIEFPWIGERTNKNFESAKSVTKVKLREFIIPPDVWKYWPENGLKYVCSK